MSIVKILKAQAQIEYQKAIAKIPEKIKYQDAARHIVDIWRSRGVGRNAHQEHYWRTGGFPRYIYLYLGPYDRAMDINMFLEEMEERFNLVFDTAEITNEGVAYNYGPWLLKIHFYTHQLGTCRVVTKEKEPTIHKNYEHSIVCD